MAPLRHCVFIYVSIVVVLVSMTQGARTYETVIVSKSRVMSCTEAMMICIEPAKRNCEFMDNSKDTYETCRVDKKMVQQKMEEIFATQVRPDGSASSMTCENGAKLHQRVMNWNRTKLFDVCGNGLIIPKGYYAVLSEDLTRITIYEQSECGEKQRCPAKDYYSYEIVPLYCRHNNETYEFRDYMFSAQNRDISPRCNAGSYLTSSAGIPSILKGTLFSVAIVIIVRSV